MTQTEEEKFRKFYDGNKAGQANELDMKVRSAMLEIIKLEDPDDGFEVFKHVITIFSEEELAHLACLYIGSHMVKMLETNPEFRKLCSIIGMMDKIGKKYD
jgi:hypothetical protein